MNLATITNIMKKLNKQTIFIVLAVHVAILLLISGGFNALGCAVILGIPLMGCVSWFAYQQGKYSTENGKKTKQLILPRAVGLFRG
jgi:hypothetical protein